MKRPGSNTTQKQPLASLLLKQQHPDAEKNNERQERRRLLDDGAINDIKNKICQMEAKLQATSLAPYPNTENTSLSADSGSTFAFKVDNEVGSSSSTSTNATHQNNNNIPTDKEKTVSKKLLLPNTSEYRNLVSLEQEKIKTLKKQYDILSHHVFSVLDLNTDKTQQPVSVTTVMSTHKNLYEKIVKLI